MSRSTAGLALFLVAIALGACSSVTGAGGGTTCSASPVCGPGGSDQVESCVTTADDGSCASTVLRYGGQEFACASCGDCTEAAMAVAHACGAGAGGDADAGTLADARSDDDAGDAGSSKDATTHDAHVDDASSHDAASNDSGDAAAACGAPPTLHPESQPGPFCPFTATGFVYCGAGQTCCDGAPVGGTSACVAAGASCPATGDSAWACEDAVDCAGAADGPVCCGAGVVSFDATCGFYRGATFTGSRCAHACGAGEVVVCETDAQCPHGKTCVAFKTQGLGLGTCL